MKIRIHSMSVATIILAFCTGSSGAQTVTPDLKAVPEGKGWKGAVTATKLVEKDGAAAIEFDKLEPNVVWLDGFEFTSGTIEFDANGKSAPPTEHFRRRGFPPHDGTGRGGIDCTKAFLPAADGDF